MDNHHDQRLSATPKRIGPLLGLPPLTHFALCYQRLPLAAARIPASLAACPGLHSPHSRGLPRPNIFVPWNWQQI